MARNRSAVAALQKLEADRQALDRKQRELEDEAALEIGKVILGTGLEGFSKKALRRIAEALARRGEAASLELIDARPDSRPKSAASTSS